MRVLARRRDERGNALEAVIIIPVLMLITFGGIEFGIGFSQKGALESASRAGARLGSSLTTESAAPAQTILGAKVASAVNAALDTTAVPELTKMYVYRSDLVLSGGSADATCVASHTCILYDRLKDSGKHFDETQPSGTWPYLAGVVATRHGCDRPGLPADKISVRIEGDFAFLTGLVGNGKIHLTVGSTLQFEPTDC